MVNSSKQESIVLLPHMFNIFNRSLKNSVSQQLCIRRTFSLSTVCVLFVLVFAVLYSSSFSRNWLPGSIPPLRQSIQSPSTNMKVIPVPCRSDNYMYIIIDPSTGTTAVVDPYDPKKLEEAAKKEGVKLGQYLLTTHHHQDHSGGNEEFIANHSGVKVYAGSNSSPGADHLLKDKDHFKIGSLDVTALHTPCHTQDHICYYVEDRGSNQRGVFTGDTLFVSGCGRFFEGTAQEMDTALNEKLASLPNETVTYVGHEYTASNVAFSRSVEPENPAILKLVDFVEKNKVTTGVSTIGDEKGWNVFMRLNSPVIQQKTGESDPVSVMQALREMKNNFRG